MANHNKVNVGDSTGPVSPNRSQGGSSKRTGGQRKEGKSRRRQSSPVIPLIGSAGLESRQTRGHRARTNPASMPGTSLDIQHLNLDSTTDTDLTPTPPLKDSNSDHNRHEVDRFLREIDTRGSEMAEGYWHAPPLPPITPDSLAELDMPRIINNPKLRHDVNFDRELHFRPNLDGSKGKQKLETAGLYWKALEGEFVMCGFVQSRKYDADFDEKREYWQGVLDASLRRLPKVFEAVSGILTTLVPDNDQQVISDRLDADLIMREISHGMCDLVDLAKWLSRVLKDHCAPMRDDMVNRMEREVIRGTTEQNPTMLVSGLKLLLNVLEAMKLDVANHQVRYMRTILVQDAVNFQKHYNAHRVANGKIDGWSSKVWIEQEIYAMMCEAGEGASVSYVDAIVSGVIKHLLFPTFHAPPPATFYLDTERLRALSQDLKTIRYHQICHDVLVEMAGARMPAREVAKAAGALYVKVAAIAGPLGQFTENVENIAAEIMRVVLLMEGRPYASFDAVLLDAATDRLMDELRIGSVLWQQHSYIMRDRLLPKLRVSADQDIKLSALQLQDKHVPPATQPVVTHALSYGAVCSPVMPPKSSDPDDHIVSRISHMVALHWQIWAEIVYLQSYEDLDEAMMNADRSPPASPSVPVAQAVYAPGHKWLPVGLTVEHIESGLPTPAPSPRPQHKRGNSKGDGKDERKSGKSGLEEKKPQQSA